MKKTLLSIVSPVYKAEKIVPELVKQIKESVISITENFEIILVCDGSPDNSWQKIKKCCEEDKRVVGINLSRNFGQHNALSAGLRQTKGQYVVVIDCDLQDNPEYIANMYKLATNGDYDIVYTRRKHRKDGLFKRMSSKLFNVSYQLLSGMKTDSTMPNFGMYSRKVIEAFNQMHDVARSFQSLISYLGFKSTIIDIEHKNRYEGMSSYSLSKLLKLSEDVIIANSNRPLRMGITMGFIMTLISSLFVIYNLILYFTHSILPGFSSNIISIWFVGGVIVVMLGIIGLYIDRIFNQVKNRPLFIIDEIINSNIVENE